jgi:hypothetical protein
MFATNELVKFHQQEIHAKCARARLARQAVPNELRASVRNDSAPRILQTVCAHGRRAEAALRTISHRAFEPRGALQERTIFTAMR